MENTKPTALITGGSRGIGLAIADRLAREGFNIAINGRRDGGEVADTIAALKKHDADVLYCQGDVADSASRQQMLEQIAERFGRLDVLINNAGVAPTQRADMLEASEESFDRLININLKGPYFLTQSAADWMIKQQKEISGFTGCIINIGSMSATVASINRGDYCISKAGVAMATQLWAARLAPLGIGVYEIRPGIIATNMTAGVKEKYDKLISEGLTIEPRWGQPEDIANAAAVLARGEITYAPGQVIVVDGGLTLQRL